MSDIPKDPYDFDENEEVNTNTMDRSDTLANSSDENSEVPNESDENDEASTDNPSSVHELRQPENVLQQEVNALEIARNLIKLFEEAFNKIPWDKPSEKVTSSSSKGSSKNKETSYDSPNVEPNSNFKETALNAEGAFSKEYEKIPDPLPESSHDCSSHEVIMPSTSKDCLNSDTPHDSPDIEQSNSPMSTEKESSMYVEGNLRCKKSEKLSKSTLKDNALDVHAAESTIRRSNRLQQRESQPRIASQFQAVETENVSVLEVLSNLKKEEPATHFELPENMHLSSNSATLREIQHSIFPLVYLIPLEIEYPGVLDILKGFEDAHEPKHSETEVEKRQKLDSELLSSPEAATPETFKRSSKTRKLYDSPDLKRSKALARAERESVKDVIEKQSNKKSKISQKSSLRKTARNAHTAESTIRNTRQSSHVDDSQDPLEGLNLRTYQAEREQNTLFPIVDCLAKMIKLDHNYCRATNSKLRKSTSKNPYNIKQDISHSRKLDTNLNRDASETNTKASDSSENKTVIGTTRTESSMKQTQEGEDKNVCLTNKEATDASKNEAVIVTSGEENAVKQTVELRTQPTSKLSLKPQRNYEWGVFPKPTSNCPLVQSFSNEKDTPMDVFYRLETHLLKLFLTISRLNIYMPSTDVDNQDRRRKKNRDNVGSYSIFETSHDPNSAPDNSNRSSEAERRTNVDTNNLVDLPPGPSRMTHWNISGRDVTSLPLLRSGDTSEYERHERNERIIEQSLVEPRDQNKILTVVAFNDLYLRYKLLAEHHRKLIPLITRNWPSTAVRLTKEQLLETVPRLCIEGQLNMYELRDLVSSFLFWIRRFSYKVDEGTFPELKRRILQLEEKITDVYTRMSRLIDRFDFNDPAYLDLSRISIAIRTTTIMYRHLRNYFSFYQLQIAAYLEQQKTEEEEAYKNRKQHVESYNQEKDEEREERREDEEREERREDEEREEREKREDEEKRMKGGKEGSRKGEGG